MTEYARGSLEEKEAQLLHNAKAFGGTMGRDLLELIDRLRKQLAEIKDAGEPLLTETATQCPKGMGWYTVHEDNIFRLAEALDKIDEVK